MWRKRCESQSFIGQWCICYCAIYDYCCHCLIVPYAKKPFFINPLPDEKILDWYKLKEIADDILKCNESEK